MNLITEGLFIEDHRILFEFNPPLLKFVAKCIVPNRTRCQKKNGARWVPMTKLWVLKPQFYEPRALFFESPGWNWETDSSIWGLADFSIMGNVSQIILTSSSSYFSYPENLRHSLLIWQNKTSQCFREIHPLFVGGSEFSRSLAPLHCFAFRHCRKHTSLIGFNSRDR